MNGSMSGWVCDSSCVVQQDDRATCDATCTDRSGKDVFISDEGAVSAITNPDVCTSHINKHVVAKFSRSDRKDIEAAQQDAIQIQELRDQGDLGGH